jgi:hypothetical protein
MADDVLPADDDVTHRPLHLKPLVRRVIAGVVQVRRMERAARGRVEHDHVGVAADLERPLSSHSEPGGGRGRQQIHHPLHGDPSARHAFAKSDREQRLDPGRAVADPVERHARRGLGLLAVESVGDVVGGEQVERAIGQPLPQGVAIRGRP